MGRKRKASACMTAIPMCALPERPAEAHGADGIFARAVPRLGTQSKVLIQNGCLPVENAVGAVILGMRARAEQHLPNMQTAGRG
jgi:hypothetical protein